MVNAPATQSLQPAHGPVAFAAALVNIVIVELAVWVVLPWLALAFYVLPLLVIDLGVALVLKSRRGASAQVGRGMLIGLLAAPISLVLFVPGLWLTQALGIV